MRHTQDLVITISNTHFQVASSSPIVQTYSSLESFWVKATMHVYKTHHFALEVFNMHMYDTCVVSVLKYKRSDDETSLRVKLNKFNIHSIRKKSDRLTSYFKILTGVEPQVL